MAHPERLLAAAFLAGAVVCGTQLYVSRPDEQAVPYPRRSSAPSAETVLTETVPAKTVLTETVPAKTAPARAAVTETAAPETAAETVPFPLDLNTASAAELMRLPHIGDVRAAQIVAWREAHGGFSRIEQLLEIPGIGEAHLAAIAPLVCLPDPAPLPTAAPAPPQEVPADVPQDAPEDAPPSDAETPPPTAPPVIDLNTATEDDLLTLPGCDAETAAAIIALRGTIGRFTSILEILYAEGVDSRLFEAWQDRLAVDAAGNTELPSDPADTPPAEEDAVSETEEG